MQISIRVLKRKWSVGPDKHCVVDSSKKGLRFHLNVYTAPGLSWVRKNNELYITDCEAACEPPSPGATGTRDGVWGWWDQSLTWGRKDLSSWL